jgi:hypothetical protein
MRRLWIMVALVVCTAAVAFAELNFKAGPLFVSNGDGSFTLTAEASGQGNRRMVAQIVLSGTVLYTCVNKGNPDNVVQGQNPIATTTKGVQDVIPSDANGRSEVDLTVGPLSAPSPIDGKAAGCPNKNWSGIDPEFVGGATATATITFGNLTVYGPVVLNYTP